MKIRVGEKIDFCAFADCKVRNVRLSRDKLAYIVNCTCGRVHYVSITGKVEGDDHGRQTLH